MRVLAVPDFNSKIMAMPDLLGHLGSLITVLEQSTREEIIKKGTGGYYRMHFIDDMLIFRLGGKGARVYASFGSDPEGDYLLLLDLTVERKAASDYFVRGPKNPRVNSKINPRVNSKINPRVNSKINPRVNSKINPRVNSKINPRVNSKINPRINRVYSGPFVYSENLDKEGFVVRATDVVELIFDMKNEWIAFCVKVNDKVCVLFDTNNEWISHLVQVNAEVRLRFDLNNDMTGLIV